MSAPKQQMMETIKVGGVFDIRNGPGECFVRGTGPDECGPKGCGDFHVQFHNKLVGQALRHIANACFQGESGGGVSGFVPTTVTNLIRVGTGTGATIDTTTALVTEVAVASSSGSVLTSTPVAGTYRITIVGTWNSGTLSAVAVTEIAIKSRLMITLGSNTVSGSAAAPILFSRLSTTDTEFTGFTVNTAAPLQITYRFDVVFA